MRKNFVIAVLLISSIQLFAQKLPDKIIKLSTGTYSGYISHKYEEPGGDMKGYILGVSFNQPTSEFSRWNPGVNLQVGIKDGNSYSHTTLLGILDYYLIDKRIKIYIGFGAGLGDNYVTKSPVEFILSARTGISVYVTNRIGLSFAPNFDITLSKEHEMTANIFPVGIFLAL